MFLLDIPEPKNCDDCLFCDSERGFCYFSTTDGTLKTTKSVIEYAKNCTKPDWCPASKKFEEVYVITSGEYSDYGINAVTVSKERAEKLQKYYSKQWYGSSPVEIETYNINEPHESVAFIIDKDEIKDCNKLYDNGYNEGLRAVECMLHVFFKNCPLRPGFGMEKQDIIEVFGTDDYGDIFANNSIKDFLEKTDEWACKKDLAEEENK